MRRRAVTLFLPGESFDHWLHRVRHAIGRRHARMSTEEWIADLQRAVADADRIIRRDASGERSRTTSRRSPGD